MARVDQNPTRHDRAFADEDTWPELESDRLLMVLHIDARHRTSLARKEVDPVRRDRIVDSATETLLSRMHEDPPECPRAWYAAVVHNLWRSSRHLPRHPKPQMYDESSATSDLRTSAQDSLGILDGRSSPATNRQQQRQWLDTVLASPVNILTLRQRRIVHAMLNEPSGHRAAEAAGETRRDIARALPGIAKRIIRVWNREHG